MAEPARKKRAETEIGSTGITGEGGGGAAATAVNSNLLVLGQLIWYLMTSTSQVLILFLRRFECVLVPFLGLTFPYETQAHLTSIDTEAVAMKAKAGGVRTWVGTIFSGKQYVTFSVCLSQTSPGL